MPYIKKLVMHGFKSFAHETEIPFDNSMNVIVGPNGSGKSNISDAICFVLGRISAKSMRAEKTSHLIFAGTKAYKPSSEASVSLVFDNSDKGFPIENKEISIERIARRSGQSIYKINNEVKTRQEVLELLAMAGIDPNGFNIVLQGEITYLVKSSAEERRKVIEEVAGISIYEVRKEKSLKELEKTDEKLKEVSAILRERTAYLRNLENERQQALKFKQLEEKVKKCKASILFKQIDEKRKEVSNLDEEIAKKSKEKEKSRLLISEAQNKILDLENKINEINLHIQKSTGLEQDTLFSEISSLRESLAGLEVRKTNAERRLEEVLSRRNRAETEIKEYESQIQELRKKSPLQAKKISELEKKKLAFEELEKEKRKFYTIKSELSALKNRIEDKKQQLQRSKNESDFILREIDSASQTLKHKSQEHAKNSLKKIKSDIEQKSNELQEKEKTKLQLEKSISIYQSELKNLEDIKKQVEKIDICPLCKSKITSEHITHVFQDCDGKISVINIKLKKAESEINSIDISELKSTIENLKKSAQETEVEIVRLENIEVQTSNIKRLNQEQDSLSQNLSALIKEKDNLEKLQEKFKDVEGRYEQTLLDIEEISSRTEQNIDVVLEGKIRDLEQTKLIIKQSFRDEEDLKQEVSEHSQDIDEKSNLLEKKEEQDIKLKEKFQKLFNERTSIQKQIQDLNTDLVNKQHESQSIDNSINESKIGKARIDAERETLEIDFQPFIGEEIIKASIESLKETLEKSQSSLNLIGSVNLRALEVYDEIKKEYDSIAEKVKTLENEKEEIMKIIAEIDIKKKKSFMKTLSAINELFTRNFMQLSVKGEVFLDTINKEDPFAAGLDIIVRVGKGKYFDVTSLSGGEQTLVALSLIFAIQEYKPYCFYIFDEVDAALDKRNSERLAALVKRYMKTGQYIIITHNDAIMTESSLLYGVTMQEGISKIISLKI